MSDGGGWLDERLADWAKRGFDPDLLSAHLSGEGGDMSEAVIHLEGMIERAEWLRRRVEMFPLAWPERNDMLEALEDPKNLEGVERRWRELVRTRRPWHSVAEKVAASWSREGRTVELEEWLERLDRIDPSMIPQAQNVLLLLEQGARRVDLKSEVVELEERQNRRTLALEEMVTHLREERGWAMAGLAGNIQERYGAVGRIQELDTLLLAVEELVKDMIGPYDPEAAAKLLQRAELAQNMEDEGRLAELFSDADEMAADYEARLLGIDNWLTELDSRNIHITAPRPPTPGDLMELEGKVEGIERDSRRLGYAWIQLDTLLKLFPEEAGRAASLQGQVELIDEVEDLLEVLQERRDENDSRARGRLRIWGVAGFEIEPFEALLEQRPRVGWLSIEEHSERVKVSKQLLSSIDLMDISYAGATEAEVWTAKLYAAGVNADDVIEVQEGIDKRLKRNSKHRHQLDEVKGQLAGSWPADLDTDTLTLAEYEAAVTALQAGERVDGHLHTLPTSERESRLDEAAKGEIDLWRTNGWDVSGLDELLERAPTELWVDLPRMRNAMDGFAHLRQRLERLPLARSQELLDSVSDDARRPERLLGLSDSLPTLAAELAGLPEIDGELDFSLFEPTLPEPFGKLLPITPTLVPRTELPEDDAADEEYVSADIEEPIVIDVVEPEPIARVGDVPWDSLVLRIGGRLDSQPRDIRIQRLARLMMALEPIEGETEGDTNKRGELVSRLDKVAERLGEWTKLRLTHRRADVGGSLLRISARLASRLEEIPTPGIELPVHEDDEELPEQTDLTSLGEAVTILEGAANIPNAGDKPVLVAAS